MGLETAALVIGSVAAVVGTGVSVYGSMQAAKAQKAARKAEEKRIRAQERRKRREQLREARIRRAASLNAGEQIGAGGGSGLAGGLSSLSSQVGSNLGYGAAMAGNALKISGLQQKAADYEQLAGFGATAARVGVGVASRADDIAAFGQKFGIE